MIQVASHSLKILRNYGILVALALMVIVVQSVNGGFITTANLLNIGDQWAPVGIMALGMTFVLIGGGFDLSVGATLAMSATVGAIVAEHHAPGLAFGLAMLIGVTVGLINGVLVTKINVNPFVATLGTAQIVRGGALIISDGGSKPVSNGLYDYLGAGEIAGVPVSFLIMILVLVVFGAVLAYSVLGRSLYAIGGNDEASYLSGVRTDRIRAGTYVLSGACAALAGAIFAGRIGSGQGNLASGIELDVIAAALIGGVSIAGGQGAVWRAAAGLGLLAVLQNFFNQQNVNAFWQLVIKGIIIVTAVGLDSYSKRPHRKPVALVLRHTLSRVRRSEARGAPTVAQSPGHSGD